MRKQDDQLSRRSCLRWLATLPLGAAMLAASAQPALAKAKKAAVAYQDQPKGERACAGCRHFQPAEVKGKPNTCKLVEGEINPNGWCAVWAKAK